MLDFDSCFSIDRCGRGGGLALFWRATFDCHLVDYSNNHISVDVVDPVHGMWKLTGYYGTPRGDVGKLRGISFVNNQTTGPWCILGDFNDIMDASEKRGRTVHSNWLINGFRQAILDSGLVDVPVEEYPFTWFNSLGTPCVVKERLDRALANSSWFHLFPNATLENLAAPYSFE